MKPIKQDNREIKNHYVLEFYETNEGGINLSEMGNGIDLDDFMSLSVLGSQLAHSGLLTKSEKLAFIHFCKSFIKEVENNLNPCENKI